MWEEIVQLALGNGIFAVMFVYLLAYELKDSRTREDKYQKTIDSLSQNLSIVDDIYSSVKETSKAITEIKAEIKELKTAILKNKICPIYSCKNSQMFMQNVKAKVA